LPIGPDSLSLLLADLAAVQNFAPSGGGSNNWAIAGSRTVTGKPLLASDPHLAPTLPGPWYLAHVRTPEGSVAGATFAGTPAFPIGHNGFACWGVTAGLTDNTDLFLETIGPDGTSVRTAVGSFVPCEVVREPIRVKGRPDVIEDVLVTPRGPVISPVIPGVSEVVSLRAVWLDPLPVRGFVDAPKATDFEVFRRPFAAWPVLPLNVVYADSAGTIGRQLIGQLPVRKGGHGLLPRPADRADSGWDGYVPFEDMPVEINPPGGIIATANNPPESPAAYLGHDFVDRYRFTVIREELAKFPVGWTVADCLKLQRNVRSKPWEELRDTALSLTPTPESLVALDLLRAWDGNVAADSPAAAVFELFVAELSCRIGKAKAPNSWAEAVGGDGTGPMAHNLFSDRRVEHLVRLVRAKPEGWFPNGWDAELTAALAAAVETLTRTRGPAPRWWTWGDARPLVLRHMILGKSRLLGAIFNRGPVPCGGDQNTVSQAGVRPLDPLAPTHNMANLRTVFDPSDWSNSRFVLAGGQSGNPADPHYDDLFALWQRGDTVPIPWTPDEVLRAAVATQRLVPDATRDVKKPQVSPGS
jgi:penicillin amidase